MTAKFEVRRARLSDAEAIAAFVNAASKGVGRSGAAGRSPNADLGEVTRLSVAERFSQVGFMVAERRGNVIGLLGWQVENLVVRVTDYLVSTISGTDTMMVSRALVEKMEEEAAELQAESVLLFLPADPSPGLVAFWEQFGYEAQCLDELDKACREAVNEWGLDTASVMIKRLRDDRVGRPL